jgi:hypothetical protein
MNRSVFVPAMIAGVFAGVLSSLPVVRDVNLALCAWMWLGGIFAVYLFRRSGAPKLTRAEGVTLGLLTGTIAGVVTVGFTLAGVGITTDVLQQTQSSTGAEPMQRALLSLQEAGMFEILAGCLSLILHMGFGALGGVMGAVLITRRRL